MKICQGIKVLATLSCLTASSIPGSAQFVGGEESPAVDLSTVAEIKEAAKLSTSGGLGGLLDMAVQAGKMDERSFTLEGRLTGRIDGNVYVFEDKTGRMNVEIDRRDFAGQRVSPSNTIRITGEAEYSELGVGLEVFRLELVK